MFCSNDSRWAPRRRGCPTSQQVDATVGPHNQTQWLRCWKQVSWSLFAETSVCETWRTSSGLFHQVHLAHHQPHAGQAHLRHPGGKRTCDLRPANQWPSTFTSCHTHDVPQMPLELSQSFVKNIDGTYSRFRCPEPPPQPDGHKTERPLPIRPLELRTFLRVGEWVCSPLSTAQICHRCGWHVCEPLQEQAQQIQRRPVHLWSSGSLMCSLAVTWESWESALNMATSRVVSWSSVRKEAAGWTQTCPKPQRPSESLNTWRTQTVDEDII